MKQIPLIILTILLGLTTMSLIDNGSTKKQDEKLYKVKHGVCRQNLQWAKNRVDEIAGNIAGADIPLVRISGVKRGGSIQQVVDNVNSFYNKGIDVHIVIPPHTDMYAADYKKIKGPNFPLAKISEIDLHLFQEFINQFVAALADKTPKQSIIGFELFNEVNWCDFNGDLPSYASNSDIEPSTGIIFDSNTSLTHPLFSDTYKGIEVYGECLKILRQAMDTHLKGREVKLVSAGLVSGGAWNNYQWEIKKGYTKVLPDMYLTLLQGKHPDQTNKTDYLKYVDAIGIHIYPPHDGGDMHNILHEHYFGPIKDILTVSKPFWVTEWGFARPKFRKTGGEAQRRKHIVELAEAFNTYPNIELTTFFEFDASKTHNIWENGELLESGTFFNEVNK